MVCYISINFPILISISVLNKTEYVFELNLFEIEIVTLRTMATRVFKYTINVSPSS